MAGVSTVEAANVILGDAAVPIPKMSDVYKGKNFHYLPTYALALSSVVGIVVIVVGAVIKNYPVCALGGLFTISSGVGTFYSWRYLQTKPLEQQVEAMGKLVENTRKTVSDVSSTLKSYQDLEEKLKQNNKTLAQLVAEFQNGIKESGKETQQHIDEAQAIVQKYNEASEKLKKDEEFIAVLQKEIDQITALLAETTKANDAFKAGLADLAKDNGDLQQSGAAIKSDVEAIGKDNKDFEQKRKALAEQLKSLKGTLDAFLAIFKKNQEALAKQEALLKTLYAKMDSFTKSADSEKQTSDNLEKTSEELDKDISILTQLLPLLKAYYADQSKNTNSAQGV